MSEKSATQNLQERLLGKLAFVNSPESIRGSLVVDLKSRTVLSAQNIDDPAATAARVSKFWHDAQALAPEPQVLRINADRQYILVGDESYILWAVLGAPDLQVSS